LKFFRTWCFFKVAYFYHHWLLVFPLPLHLISSGGNGVGAALFIFAVRCAAGAVLESRKSKQSMWCTPWQCAVKRLIFCCPWFASFWLGEKYGHPYSILHLPWHTIYFIYIRWGINAAYFEAWLKVVENLLKNHNDLTHISGLLTGPRTLSILMAAAKWQISFN